MRSRTRISRIYERVLSRIRTSHVTYTNESCHVYERVMSHRRFPRKSEEIRDEAKKTREAKNLRRLAFSRISNLLGLVSPIS